MLLLLDFITPAHGADGRRGLQTDPQRGLSPFHKRFARYDGIRTYEQRVCKAPEEIAILLVLPAW